MSSDDRHTAMLLALGAEPTEDTFARDDWLWAAHHWLYEAGIADRRRRVKIIEDQAAWVRSKVRARILYGMEGQT